MLYRVIILTASVHSQKDHPVAAYLTVLDSAVATMFSNTAMASIFLKLQK